VSRLVTAHSAVRVGARATVRVPASTANLGPGFDAVALALGWSDDVDVEALDPADGVVVEVVGEGAGRVGDGEDHLVVRSLRASLDAAGAPQPGLRLVCRNGVPHGRGVGSSAAAVVAGAVAGRALLEDPSALADDDLLDLVCGIEGHPDNAAASLLGGLTLGWREGRRWRAVRSQPHPDLDAVVMLPGTELSTARARALLPTQVPHGDAAWTAGRAALLVEALTRRPDLLLPATDDRLHQRQRASVMPEAWDLVVRLRDRGEAAVVSGAGPTVLVLTTADRGEALQAELAGTPGWRAERPGLPATGAVAERS
jgi:homoserine kinase